MEWEKIDGKGRPYEHQPGCFVWCVVCELPVSKGFLLPGELGSGAHPGDFIGICAGGCAELAVAQLETEWMGHG